VKEEHVKNVAQDEGVKAVILPIAIFRWRDFFKNLNPQWSRPAEPRALPGRCTTRAKPSLWPFNLEVGNLAPQNAQGRSANGLFIVAPSAC